MSQGSDSGLSPATEAALEQTRFEHNHFELFGLPVAFEVDAELLAQRYRELQRSVHPDRYASASDRERRLSVQRAAQINEAYQCLRKPLARARYLLQLQGAVLDDERDTHLDPGFLMEQMELREALEAAPAAADPLAEIAGLMQSIQSRMQAVLATFPELFAAQTEAALMQARENVQKMQFLERDRKSVV